MQALSERLVYLSFRVKASKEKSHEKGWHKRRPDCSARRRSWFSTPSRAETGQVAVVFTKGGFIGGVGGGEGVLAFRGKRYPFTVSGMSAGFTTGASTTKLVGRAINLKGSASIEGTFSTASRPCQ
jgi:hypothetical protein